ncbi:hypothetical protein C8R44DRAFT_725083 [Mycena epipterygia]|nr:hypothetical protein C8R44DRAFT_725083 [Mycena epipterygia]
MWWNQPLVAQYLARDLKLGIFAFAIKRSTRRPNSKPWYYQRTARIRSNATAAKHSINTVKSLTVHAPQPRPAEVEPVELPVFDEVDGVFSGKRKNGARGGRSPQRACRASSGPSSAGLASHSSHPCTRGARPARDAGDATVSMGAPPDPRRCGCYEHMLSIGMTNEESVCECGLEEQRILRHFPTSADPDVELFFGAGLGRQALIVELYIDVYF